MAATGARATVPGRHEPPAGSPWSALQQLAMAQHGAFAVRQATSLGLPATVVRQRLRREAFLRPYRGVAVLPGFASIGLTRSYAATLSLGEDAVLTGQPSLASHGLLRADGLRPHVVYPQHSRRQAPEGVRLRRTRTLAATDWGLTGGVRVAVPERAILDAAAFLSRDRLRALLIDGRQRRLVDVEQLGVRATELPQLAGRERLLAACGDVVGSGADSPLVVEVEGWLRGEGFHLDVPPRTVPTPTRVLHPDITLHGLPVGVEVDGFGYHASRTALDLDQRKHNAYLLAGWIVLRITWDRLRQDPAGFLAELKAAVVQVEGGSGSAAVAGWSL